MSNNFMYDPNNYDANGNLKNPMLQQMAQTAMQATAQQRADSQRGMGALEQYRPQDGYLSGMGREARLDNRKLTNSEQLDRINPFSESGHMNSKDYAKRYAPDGTLRSTGEKPKSASDGEINNPKIRQIPWWMSGGSGVGGQPDSAATPALTQDDAPNAAPPALTQSVAEPTTHTMPDGTVMEGATHEAYLQANQPALDLQDEYGNLGAEFGDEPLVPGQEGYVAPVEDRSVPSGVLSQRLQTLGQMDAVNQPDNTSRKRDKGMSGENLMRIGGAIMGGSSRGNMEAMSAGLAKYGELKDYGREQERLGLERDATLAEAERKQKADQAEVDAERFGSPAEIYAAQELTGKISSLRADLANPDFNAVGATKNFIFNRIGGMAGTDEASIRLRLQELVVDKTLSNTAFTKGAITDKEMALFRSDIPQFTDSEEIWEKWLKDYEAATRMMEHNLRTGYAPFKEQNARGGGSSGEVDDLLSKYE